MKANNGQSLVEFTLAATLILPSLLLLGGLLLTFVAKSYLVLDAYYLLRAQRYGKTIPCQPARYWPARSKVLRADFQCLQGGEVKIRLASSSKTLWETQLKLR
jgi:hypothetical protein